MTRNFILKTLLPYKENRKLCASQYGQCMYLTEDGRKCAVGMHLKQGEWQKFIGDVEGLDDEYSLEQILLAKARKQQIPLKVWEHMQSYHDALSVEEKPSNIRLIVERLEKSTGFKFEELLID